MINRPTSMPAFSQVALGVVIGCLPILALILLDGCRPGWLIYGLYLTLNLALYLYLRYLPWVGFGIFLSLINLVPLLFASFKGGEYFGAISFAGVIKYYLPLCTVGFFLAEGSGVLAEPLTEPLNSKKLSGLATSVMVELGSLVTPWLCLGLIKILGLKPFGWPLAFYILFLADLGLLYVGRWMVPTLSRYSEPLPTVPGMVVFGLWFYSLGFMFFYGLKDNHIYALIYSPHIDFTSAALYYALYFAAAIFMILTQATKIKAVIRDRQIQLDSRYEELVRWFESQNLQRELEKKDDLFIDFVQAELHDFTGLSRKANSLDLKRARSYWSRRLGRAWTGKYGPSASEDTEKLRRINLALDAIQKTIEN